MKYSIYIIIFSAIGVSLFLWLSYFRRLKRDMLFKLAARQLAAGLTGGENGFFFSTPGLREILRRLMRQKNHRAISQLLAGQTAAAEQFLKKKKAAYPLAALKAFISPCRAEKDFVRLCADFPDNDLYRAELAKVYFMGGQNGKATETAERISEKSGCRYARAIKYYLQSLETTQAGEMQEASQYASAAVKIFNREKAFFESGTVYLQLGTIYRVSAVSDVAQTMFESAAEIFRKMKIPAAEAEALGNLGMLTAAQNRFEEAESYFEQALKLNLEANRKRGQAEILNQQALLEIMQQKHTAARKLAQKALKLHAQEKNCQGQAFSWDILSYINLAQKKYDDLLASTGKALQLYDPQKNLSAVLEMTYTQASAYFAKGGSNKAENLLRQIIRTAAERDSCFHVANAYNLLGLIFLQKKDFKRAKGLFQQAVSFEERNDRLNCAAVDYANIALIEQKCGNLSQARKTLQLALDYAESFGAGDLAAEIRKQLDSTG